MKNKTKDIFPLTEQESELLRTKLFPDDCNRDWEYTSQSIKENLAYLKDVFIASKFRAGLKFDCYGYWPVNAELTKWIASDGSQIEKTFVEMLCGYGTPDDAGQYLQMEFEDMEQDFVIPKRMRQEEFEDTYM